MRDVERMVDVVGQRGEEVAVVERERRPAPSPAPGGGRSSSAAAVQRSSRSETFCWATKSFCCRLTDTRAGEDVSATSARHRRHHRREGDGAAQPDHAGGHREHRHRRQADQRAPRQRAEDGDEHHHGRDVPRPAAARRTADREAERDGREQEEREVVGVADRPADPAVRADREGEQPADRGDRGGQRRRPGRRRSGRSPPRIASASTKSTARKPA